jgi:hypothetical protein
MLLPKNPKVNGGVLTGARAHRNLQRTVKSSVLGEALFGLKPLFFKRNEGAVMQFFRPSY